MHPADLHACAALSNAIIQEMVAANKGSTSAGATAPKPLPAFGTADALAALGASQGVAVGPSTAESPSQLRPPGEWRKQAGKSAEPAPTGLRCAMLYQHRAQMPVWRVRGLFVPSPVQILACSLSRCCKGDYVLIITSPIKQLQRFMQDMSFCPSVHLVSME